MKFASRQRLSLTVQTHRKVPAEQEIHDAFLAYIASIFALIVSFALIIAAIWQGFVARELAWGYIDLIISTILMFSGGWLAKYSNEILERQK